MNKKVEGKIKKGMETPEKITLCNLEVVVMPNGEVICLGKAIGWVKEMGKYLTEKPNN